MPDISFELNGATVTVADEGSLLDALRESLGDRSVKDGCSPQGQCGCCTVWVDGTPRVACVTPVARVRGRSVTTINGLEEADAWASQLATRGASQCGFCTPGIVMRLAGLPAERRSNDTQVRKALLGHLCRCTGWQPVIETAVGFDPDRIESRPDIGPATRRAGIEGGVPQRVGADVAMGRGGFVDDSAPRDALVGLRNPDGEWVLGESLAQARQLSGKVQGRRTTAPVTWPIAVPDGPWVRTLQTTWVEPAYLEPDAAWCAPGETPRTQSNGGAFGAKTSGALGAEARRLADEHGRTVRLLATREDVVRLGPKRPPLAAGIAADGTGSVVIARTEGAGEIMLPAGFELSQVEVAGPPTSVDLRGAVTTEVLALQASLQPGPDFTVSTANGATATARVDDDGITVELACGEILDAAVLRSYCIGAAHMALGLVTTEALAVDADGAPLDLTIRSFGVVRAVDMPEVTVVLGDGTSDPVNGSDAVFAAVAAAVWSTHDFAPRWPVSAV